MSFSEEMLDALLHKGVSQEVWALAEEVRRLQSLQIPPAKEWPAGVPDGWSWVRRTIERSAPEFAKSPARIADSRLKETAYETMGWVHHICHYAVAGYRTYLAICLEQQKRADEAEAALAEAGPRAVAAFIDDHGLTCDCCQHVMIDVTSARDSKERQHCIAGDSEGEGIACGYTWHADAGKEQARADKAESDLATARKHIDFLERELRAVRGHGRIPGAMEAERRGE
jgi:hypothetical protein